MRETKYRARDIATGKWYIGSLNPVKGEINFATFFANIQVGSFDVKTLGEYTGLKDKTGTEIYEGDCFKTSNKHGYSANCVGEVLFQDGSFIVHIHRKDLLQVAYAIDKYREYYSDSFEIIGNIYQNPELLENR